MFVYLTSTIGESIAVNRNKVSDVWGNHPQLGQVTIHVPNREIVVYGNLGDIINILEDN
jgi:hypothetical protein